MLALLSLVVVLALPHAEGTYCDFVLTKNCNADPEHKPVCGTNGVTYNNACFFAKGHCIDTTLNQAYVGPCGTKPSGTTAQPATQGPTGPITTPVPTAPITTPVPIDGALIALDIFCLDIAYISCGTNGPRVCGSNGIFYENMCEFDKARCTHRDIHSNGLHCS